MADPWEGFQEVAPAASGDDPWSGFKEVPAATTSGDIGRGTAFMRGTKAGVTANFRDELSGLGAAAGRGGDMTILGLPVGKAVGGVRMGIEALTGQPGEATAAYEAARDRSRAELKQAEEQYPGTTLAGQIVGSVTLPGGAAARTATLPVRMARGAGVGAGVGAVSGAGEGTDAASRITKAATGAAVGSAIGGVAPPIIEGAARGVAAAARPIRTALRGVTDVDAEAARRVTSALERDMRADPGAATRLTPQEFAGATGAGGPARIIDMGADTTRALARSAANTSPEGRGALERTIQDRYGEQSGRIMGWLQSTFHYPNAKAQQDAIEQTARTVNRGAYARAYRDGDTSIWSPELERLTGSPDVVAAMRDAATKGKSRAITQGFGGFNAGVTVSPSGIVTFNRGPTGVPTYPNLQFWDYTKRAIDDAANAARRQGRDEEAGTLGQLARQLRGELDRIVPSYQQARAGSASFFGAENALEAGQNFVASKLGNREARQALARMSPTERQLFQDGFVSRFVETLGEVGDRRNVLNAIAQSPAARERLMIAIGPQRARELEAHLRVEGIMDMARGAVSGNSTTARQLAELGLAGGTGSIGAYGIYSMDPTQVGVAAVMGALMMGKRGIDQRVSRRVAEMLVSDDPQVLARGINIVARNHRFLQALRTADERIAAVAGQQGAQVPVLPSMGIGRAEGDQPERPRPSGQ